MRCFAEEDPPESSALESKPTGQSPKSFTPSPLVFSCGPAVLSKLIVAHRQSLAMRAAAAEALMHAVQHLPSLLDQQQQQQQQQREEEQWKETQWGEQEWEDQQQRDAEAALMIREMCLEQVSSAPLPACFEELLYLPGGFRH